MILKVNYDHIFFDNYTVNKENEARYIVSKILDELQCEYSENNMTFYINDIDLYTHIEIEKIIYSLKKEFYIIVSINEEEKIEIAQVSYADEIVSYIRKNYQYETLCAAEVCENVGIARREADSIMTENHSMTLTEYICHIRVEKAKEMLLEMYSVENCAQVCGFGSVKTMQRAFKKTLGMAPSLWRAANLDSGGCE